jgi:hypothetical protein
MHMMGHVCSWLYVGVDGKGGAAFKHGRDAAFSLPTKSSQAGHYMARHACDGMHPPGPKVGPSPQMALAAEAKVRW